jgi:hypothetical protein
MAQQVLQAQIAISHVKAMQVRLVVLVIVSTCIGVAQHPRLRPKSYRVLDHGCPWGAIRMYIHFPFLNEI